MMWWVWNCLVMGHHHHQQQRGRAVVRNITNRNSKRACCSSVQARNIHYILCCWTTLIMVLYGLARTGSIFDASIGNIHLEREKEANSFKPLESIARPQELDQLSRLRLISSPIRRLRLDWTNLTLNSDLAHRMSTHQTNCSLPLGNFIYRNRYGLGSDLHVWGQALCNGMESNVRIRTVGNWTWADQHVCRSPTPGSRGPNIATNTAVASTNPSTATAMTCYFPRSEIQCPEDHLVVQEHPTFDSSLHNISRPNGWTSIECDSILQQHNVTKQDLRTAGTEYLFSQVSEHVVQEAERQLALVFRDAPEGKPPDDLITVHIRWGDKAKEMKLVPIQTYIHAVHQILEQRSDNTAVLNVHSEQDGTPPSMTPPNEANIFLATEDPAVVEEFKKLAPSTWKVYVDQYFHDMLPHRIAEYNGSPKMSILLGGRAGLAALGSLLVCMEANDFVLTTASNWSRLMNELRISILNPRCNNCTTMIDLRHDRNAW